jgi:hypothetical protein
MRGVLIQKLLEFRLEVPLEVATQGEKVPCTVTVKNHGGEPVSLPHISLELALGDLKKVKAKSGDAFTLISAADFDRSTSLGSGAQAVFTHEFILDRNAPISNKAATPYLLYGDAEERTMLGQLPLTVTMHPYLRSVFDTFETVFSFINKGESWKDGYTSVKFKAPDLRKLSLVEEMSVGARFVDESLEVIYAFRIKKFEAGAQSLNVKKGKAEVVQHWASSDYLFGGNFIRQEFVEKMIEEALAVVSTGL